MFLSVAGRNLGIFKSRVTQVERTGIYFGEFNFNLMAVIFSHLLHFLLHIRQLLAKVHLLPPVSLYIKQASLVSKPVFLTPDTQSASPVIEQVSVLPFHNIFHQAFFYTDPIQRMIGFIWDITHFAQCGQEVRDGYQAIHLFPGFDLLGPFNKHGRTHSTFVHGTLFSFHTVVPSPHSRTIVAKVDNNSVVFDSKLFSFG